ncbi:hypothetical protein [Actinomadura sp.]|jgi:uncharacterized protein YbjQ (UPF0145 family)|uniref:hypothetical protein n=1 Tax=Actinomadura sp. TaxID=1989 RepID=UPI0037C6315B
MYTTDFIPGDQRRVEAEQIRVGESGASAEIALENLAAAVQDLHPDAVVGVGFTAVPRVTSHGRGVVTEVGYVAYGTCVRYEPREND